MKEAYFKQGSICTAKRITCSGQSGIIRKQSLQGRAVVEQHCKQGFSFKMKAMVNKSLHTVFKPWRACILTHQFINEGGPLKKIVRTYPVSKTFLYTFYGVQLDVGYNFFGII